MSYLKQTLSGFAQAENIFLRYQQTEAMGECHGYEALRRLSLELSIKSRGEVMQSQYNQIVAGSSFANDRSLQLPNADLVLATEGAVQLTIRCNEKSSRSNSNSNCRRQLMT